MLASSRLTVNLAYLLILILIIRSDHEQNLCFWFVYAIYLRQCLKTIVIILVTIAEHSQSKMRNRQK
jgi:hypothetical protein